MSRPWGALPGRSRVRERDTSDRQPKAPTRRQALADRRDADAPARATGPTRSIEALHSAQEAFGYLDDGRPALRRPEPGGAAVARSSASRPSTTTSRSSRRASTPASCAPGPPATSTAPAGSWRHPRRPRGRAQADDRGRQGSRCSRPAASGPAASRPPRSSTARSRAGSTARRARRRGWSAVTEIRDRADGRPARRARAPPGGSPGHGPRPGGPGARLRLRLRGGQLPVGRVRTSVLDRPRRAGHRARADRRRRQARRLPRPVRRGPAGPDPRDRRAVQPGPPGRRSTPSWPPWHAAARRRPSATRPPFFARQVRIVTENSGRDRPREPRATTSPPAATRRCATVLTRADPGRGPRRDHQQRPARPRRRRLPDRPEVGHGRQGRRRAAST